MSAYRLYGVDANGHIHHVEEFEAQSDEEAARKARELRPRAHQSELWDRSRLVAKLNPDGQMELTE